MYHQGHMSITLRDAAPQELHFNPGNDGSTTFGTDLADLETSAEGYFSRENLLRKTDYKRVSPIQHLPVSTQHRTPEHGRVAIDSAGLFTYPQRHDQQHILGLTPTPPRRQSSVPFSHSDQEDGLLQDVCYFEDAVMSGEKGRYPKVSNRRKSAPHTVTTSESVDNHDNSGISVTCSKSMEQELQEAAAAAESCPAGGRKLDDSLTNIQWLEGMKCNNLNSGSTSIHRDLRLLTSQRQIDKISRECGRTKRPPFSYMHLIQMAICSSPDGRKTLKEIYQWIQDQFPYYKHHPNQGWKNSIRHNLSLYDIFVREKNKQPGQTGCSYWTIRPDAECKPLRAKHTAAMVSKEELPDDNVDVSPVYVVNGYESPENIPVPEHKSSKKAGPVPLLPKPPPVQAYALIPIQGGMPMLSQPVLVQSVTQAARVAQQALTGEGCTSPIPWATPEDLIDIKPKAMKRNIAPPPTQEVPRRKQPKILAKPNILNRAIRIKSEPNDSILSTDSGLDLSCSISSDRTRQLSASSSLCGDPLAPMGTTSNMFTPTSQGLPKPKMYNKRKCKLIPKLHREEGMDDTNTAEKSLGTSHEVSVIDYGSFSESGVQDLLASVGSELSSPLRSLLQTPPKGNLMKEEVLPKSDSSTPDFILVSPIQGSGSESSRRGLEKAGGFLFTPESELRCSRKLTGVCSSERTGSTPPKLTDPFTFTHLKSSTPYHSEASPKLKMGTPFKLGSPSLCFKNSSDKSPGLGSLQGLGLQGLTPLKSPQRAGYDSPEGCLSNQSFTRLFGEFHLDSMLEDSINIDVSDLNFSVLQ